MALNWFVASLPLDLLTKLLQCAINLFLRRNDDFHHDFLVRYPYVIPHVHGDYSVK